MRADRLTATTYDPAALARFELEPIPAGAKGIPRGFEGASVADLVASKTPFPAPGADTPTLLLRDLELQQNIETMARYCREHDALLAPHGKTTMSPQIIARQIDAGAWAMTAATPTHCLVYRRLGVQRILLANQLVSPAAVSWLCEEMTRDADFEFYCLVDSAAGAARLAGQLERFGAPRPVRVLAEVGFVGGRSGARQSADLAEAIAVVHSAERLELAGIECYEGLFASNDSDSSLELVDRYLDTVAATFEALSEAAALPQRPLLSAGGSAYFDRVVAKLGGLPAQLVLRSGCYATQDGGFYQQVSPLADRGDGPAALRNAIELWSSVLSRPEPGLVIVDFGRRDAPFDQGLPIPVRWRACGSPDAPLEGAKVGRLSDQHAQVIIRDDEPIEIGDSICFSISHPCGAFDRWRLIPMVNPDGLLVGVAQTFF